MGVAAARAKGHGYHLRTPVTEEVSAYYAATSPNAMQEARQKMATQPEQPVQSAPALADPFGSAFERPVTGPNDAERQPTLREYLDLPSDTTALPHNEYTDPFVQSETQDAVEPIDPGVNIVPSTPRANRFAGDFPAELLPRRN